MRYVLRRAAFVSMNALTSDVLGFLSSVGCLAKITGSSVETN